ncbi:hypothetical protein D3C80_1578340 [compost metagenome]
MDAEASRLRRLLERKGDDVDLSAEQRMFGPSGLTGGIIESDAVYPPFISKIQCRQQHSQLIRYSAELVKAPIGVLIAAGDVVAVRDQEPMAAVAHCQAGPSR